VAPDAQNPQAGYFDGVSTARRAVALYLDLSNRSLLLIEGESVADRWPLDEIRLVEKPAKGSPVRYRRADRDGPRLSAGRDSLDLIAPHCPNLRRVPPRERQSARLAFWIGAGILSVIGLMLFSLPYFARQLAVVFPPKLEARLGTGTDHAIRTLLGNGRELPLCNTGAGRPALTRLGRRLADAAGMAPPPSIEVVDSPILNAFALPGNRVVVLRGLLDKSPGPDALAGVLGHEFGHIAHRDPMEAAIRESGLSMLIGLLVGDVYGGSAIGGAALVLLNTAYSRDAEAAADGASLDTLDKAGIDSAGTADFFRVVAAEEAKMGAGSTPLFLMTHPDSGDREALFRQHAEAHPEPGGPALGDADWRAIKTMCVRKPKPQPEWETGPG